MGFIELSARTAFSFGDGSVSPEALAARAALLGYSAIGITDTADLGGIVRFGLEARRQNIRPIIGAELNVEDVPPPFWLAARTDSTIGHHWSPDLVWGSSRPGRREMEKRRAGARAFHGNR